MNFNSQANVALQAAGLAIKAGGSAVLKAGNTFLYSIDGNVYSKTAADLAALTGITVEAGYKAVVSVFLNASGTASYVKSAEMLVATQLTTASFASEQNAKALIGRFIVSNATASTQFVGGTTALDLTNVTVTYLDVTSVTSL
jgi:hypothetical protein